MSVGDIVDYTAAPPAAEAFEVFMGRRYDAAERGLGLGAAAVLATQDVLAPSHPGFDALAKHLTAALEGGGSGGGVRRPAGPPRRLETPLARYTRIVEDVAALQAELRAVEASDKRRAGAAGGGGGAAAAAAVAAAAGAGAGGDAGGVMKLLTAGTGALSDHLRGLREAVAAADAAVAAGAAGAGGDPDTIAAAADARAPLAALRGDVAALREAQAVVAAAADAMRVALATMDQRLTRALAGAGGGGAAT